MARCINATTLILRMVTVGAYIAEVGFAGFGSLLIYLGATGDTEFSFFGQTLKSTNVGVASIFIGTAALVLLIRRALKSVDAIMRVEEARDGEASIVERSFDLQHPSENWGKPVARSSGSVIFYDHYKGRLAGRATLVGLVPNHTYVLTINGRPGRPGNENLRK